MKKNALALMLATVVFAGTAAADEITKLRIGVEGAYPPFSYATPSGDIEGFDIDIANALCHEMKVECTLVSQDWDGMIPALMIRKFDAIIASMNATEERKKQVAFTDKYHHAPAKFIAKKGAGIEISKSGLTGKSIGVQRSTIFDTYLSDNYGDLITIKRYGTQTDAYLDMKAGRLDLLLADSVNAASGFLDVEGGEDYEFVGPGLTDPRWFGEGASIAIRKNDVHLKDKFNQALKTIRTNGVYKAINDKYFNFDVYGN
ncbi:ABC transporter substrate-binding protein [Aliamphritea spongicola]|uniref:ABC transporter substrate-binding protein n=1 Tax=Aliamphritea spongicola TaxID=707589 RepID=UPI00196B1A31|nr:ABC transporter substrate-binding protein [Aliamphritea spongicola]MBN3560759.1 ABC transporter substrate-binding protein [Aliamphritea spongicola]